MSKTTSQHPMNDEEPGAASSSKIPDFTSREEETAWWDRHSIVDYLDELEPVRLKFARFLETNS